ncbi:class I adenylate-forming enzyme family protein [Stigmatella aurantiaca]|uniref:Long-chain fatty acid-CoA ligase n=1 Tax=Stigmatella aurantiaca (strain DW4/3-1) TaxID=378806 RepID=Q098U6_STIAD|nr:acyl-CoA synthetase [Stigmatella aurantiaca]ADO75508.1 long-chain fatty acid-CoA ligase [Stigmatella aurantiaca DW4/3-1]EAU68261.1 malonyl CoA synthetase [Stigmatella aurantiaca DW4/3-1]
MTTPHAPSTPPGEHRPESPCSILEVFLEHARKTPDRLALSFEAKRYTYGELARHVTALAQALLRRHLKPGERVALYLENSPAFVIAYLGVQYAHGIVVLVNTQYRQVELDHILTDSETRVCVTGAAGATELTPLLGGLPALEWLITAEPLTASPPPSLTVLSLDTLLAEPVEERPMSVPGGSDIAVLGYTSGTTGRSKGAMLRQSHLLSNIRAVTQAWRWTEQDRLLLALPLFHTHGLMVGLHGTLYMGASVDLRRRFVASETLETLRDDPAITLFFGVPTMYGRLLEESRRTGVRPRPLRLMVSGSAPLSAQLFHEIEAEFGQRILERYGMTETIMNTTNPYEGERRPGTVGMPFPGQEARVVDVRTRKPVPDGEPGEIEVRGPHVFAGYWRREQATEEAFDKEGGWFRTGDLGLRDADGYFHITGRARELIISGGFNIYPREVEEVLATHPGVGEVAVLGLPDPDFGEQVVAVVVPAAGQPVPGVQALVDWCKDRLASFKKPRRVEFVDALPRNALGKVQKHVLRERLLPR